MTKGFKLTLNAEHGSGESVGARTMIKFDH